MIKSYFENTNSRTSLPLSYATKRQIQQKQIREQKNKKYKLFLVLLTRATYRTMKATIDIMLNNSRIVPDKLFKMAQLVERNHNLTFYLVFQRIKVAASQDRANQKIIKNIVNLLQRIEKYKLKQVFSKIQLYTTRVDQNFINNFFIKRDSQFVRMLNTLFKRKKKISFDKIISWAHFTKSFGKLRVISVIQLRLQRHVKQIFFNRLHGFLLKKGSKHQIQREMGDMRTQLEDMSVQLENKNENIQRLQTEIQQLKIEQSNLSFNHNLSYGEYTNKSKGVIKSSSQKRFSDKSIGKQSAGGCSIDELSLNDMSIGSILGNLNKSRTGSISKYDSGCQCSCGFRAKYQKYKNLHQSLKNQLEIVKQELQVAKDLNQHFTNQIKQYLTGQNVDADYDKLKRQNQSLMDQRDQLRQKVFKYQKHINNLKAEFKVKMEELYRKVRKDM